MRLSIWHGKGAATPEAVAENLDRLEAVAALAALQGAHLQVFQELYLSGNILTPELTRQLAEPARMGGEERFYVAIALFGADGQLLRNDRKTHLWGPDEKLSWSRSYALPEESPVFTVQAVNGMKEGLLNGYEAVFPD